MTLFRKLVYSGVHFAKDNAHRRSILLSNIVSLIVFIIGMLMYASYHAWYGMNAVTLAIPVVGLLSLLTIFLNNFNKSVVSRLWLTLLIPASSMAISIYAKKIYYPYQEDLDYFSFRFIMLASCVFPAIFFSFRERTLLITTLIAGLLVLMLHDPLHAAFDVPYRKGILKETNYSFANIVILVTWFIMMTAVIFLKWISEKNEETAQLYIAELNKVNQNLIEKKSEVEAQHREISTQAETLNISQNKLQQAYRIIEEQKNQLLQQNKNLSNELRATNKDLAATNAELIKYNNELREFSYTVSHNLRGPVASLLGLINLMNPKSLNSEYVEIYHHLKTAVNHLDEIIADLSKIINIRNDIFNVRQKILLGAEVKDILYGFKREIDTCNVKISTDFSRCPEIYAIRPLVHGILFNLISNAIKYRSPTRRAEIELFSDTDDKNYIIGIKDNGLGIDLGKHQEDLFRLYKRFHFHTEGKGLGLYLVKLQTEALGGQVEVRSEINQGTQFTIYLDQPKNVERQILYEEPHLKIFFDARIDAIGTIWHGPVSSAQYRDAFIKGLEFIKSYSTPNYIADITDQGSIEPDDQRWMFNQILPQAAQHGLKRIATIQPTSKERHATLYLKDIGKNLLKFDIHQENFSTMEAATEWMHAENQKSSIISI